MDVCSPDRRLGARPLVVFTAPQRVRRGAGRAGLADRPLARSSARAAGRCSGVRPPGGRRAARPALWLGAGRGARDRGRRLPIAMRDERLARRRQQLHRRGRTPEPGAIASSAAGDSSSSGIERTRRVRGRGRLLANGAGRSARQRARRRRGMIAMMERFASILALENLPDGKATVGFEVCVKHVAAAARAAPARCTARLDEVVRRAQASLRGRGARGRAHNRRGGPRAPAVVDRRVCRSR